MLLPTRIIRPVMLRGDHISSAFDKLANLGPDARIAVWLLATVTLAALIHVVSRAMGLDFSILAKSGGSAVLISLALVLLLAIVATNNRPMAEYGLVADRHWLRQGATGFAAGFFVYSAYCVLACLAGVFVLQSGEVAPYQCLTAVVAFATRINPLWLFAVGGLLGLTGWL